MQPDKIIADNQYFNGIKTRLVVQKKVTPVMNIWLIHFDYTNINEQDFLQHIRRHKQVNVAQFNHLTKLRATIPNDQQFGQQWQYINDGSDGGVVDADLDIDLAWDITTGGVTIQGDTIVACIIDDGVELLHPDYGDNLWVNHAEIPNNNIDDDANGYIDDYLGWNTLSDNDDVGGGDHGNSVTGIIGAKGNNDIGVSGVNWNVKLMTVIGGSGNEANILSSYTYPYFMRKRYNESNGVEGAFVVVTNSSWGTDFGQPDEAPLWCAFYDTLGQVGILSCGATTNSNTNVDVQGDLPTACSSDFLISVTNMGRDDIKVTDAGYGTTTIDLGAFGAETWTLSYGLDYDAFGGTSGATPHVAGTVALLYAVACPSFITLAKTNPAQAALHAKQYILEGVDTNNSLQGITVTGGRLNINNTLNLVLQNCGDCSPVFNIVATNITTNALHLTWQVINVDTTTTPAFNILYRSAGTAEWNTAVSNHTTNNYSFNNLLTCHNYEFVIERICSDTISSSQVATFRTDGCCENPHGVVIMPLFENAYNMSWLPVTAATAYNVRYRELGQLDWLPTTVTDTTYVFPDLLDCTQYEAEIQTICADSASLSFSESYVFTTGHCGACTDLAYCATKGEDASYEWVDSLSIGALHVKTGTNGGYYNGTNPLTPSVFKQGLQYPIYLVPEFDGQPYDEYFKVFIDYNQDGDFEDSNETAFDAGQTTQTPINANITIPTDATLGLTRLRVTMKWINNDQPPTPCETFGFGEVEDYCIYIDINTLATNTLDEVSEYTLLPNPTSQQLFANVVLQTPTPQFEVTIINIDGKVLYQNEYKNVIAQQPVIFNLSEGIQSLSSGMYYVRFRSKTGFAYRKFIKQ